MIKTPAQLKARFAAYMKPTAQDFGDLIETHNITPVTDNLGGLYLGDVGRVTTSGSLSLSTRQLTSPPTPLPLHYFDIQYSTN